MRKPRWIYLILPPQPAEACSVKKIFSEIICICFQPSADLSPVTQSCTSELRWRLWKNVIGSVPTADSLAYGTVKCTVWGTGLPYRATWLHGSKCQHGSSVIIQIKNVKISKQKHKKNKCIHISVYIFLRIFTILYQRKSLFCVNQSNHLLKVSITMGFTLCSIYSFTFPHSFLFFPLKETIST